MNNIVAIDTSTEACSVALKCGGEIIDRYRVEPRVHAKALLPMLNELLAEAGITAQQLNAVAFARGPGAFTGVRIGTSAAQAIALPGDLPVVPVSTLASIAHRAHREHNVANVAAAIDARMGEVYWGAYKVSDGIAELVGTERVCSADLVDQLDATWYAAGTGWQTYKAELTQQTGASTQVQVDPFPHARDILILATGLLSAGQAVSAELALPVYLRDNVAQTEQQRARK